MAAFSGAPHPPRLNHAGGVWSVSAPALAACSPAVGSHHSPDTEAYRRLSPSAHQGDYSDDVYDSPTSTSSDESLHNHIGNATPAASPNYGASPVAGTMAGIARVSLDHGRNQSASPQPHRGRGILTAPSSIAANKRSASQEMFRPCRISPGAQTASRVNVTRPVTSKVPKRDPLDRNTYDRQQQFRATSIENPQRRMIDHKSHVKPFVQSHNRPKKETAIHRDSGYETARSRENTGAYPNGPTVDSTDVPSTIYEQYDHDAVRHCKGLIQLPAYGRYPGLILQPDSSPISQEQLEAEVKGIYAGLVMVETKCINIDAAQAADPKQQLRPEQWQALIALHRTLLYEHHDFLMATQHPSANQALRGLATKYSMPARMWKHGIHAFLEVLRHRRPESQDYMLSFVYLAYQMMALLFETVPSFTDTWIECLGDLARYRMAIEEEKEAHATWGGVAARWYTLASDRHPAIGRLYHHLGILERPSLRKFCLYTKSLTCVIPFANARDSLSTLCGPIVQDELAVRSSTHSVEARAVTFHAMICSRCDVRTIKKVASDALGLLRQQSSKLRDFGAYLAITNIASLFELGSPSNMMFQQYTTAINQAMQQARPLMATSNHSMQFTPMPTSTTPNPLLDASKDFWAGSFNTLLQCYTPTLIKDYLPFVHVMLVSIHSLHSLRTRLLNGQPLDTYEPPVDAGVLNWGTLAHFLNTLAQQEPISARVLECARQGVFLAPERKEAAKPLSEDYLLRGLMWGQFYFSPGWFDGQSEDDGRAIETQNMQTARAQRVLWLGLYLAFHTELIQYDVRKKVFSCWRAFAATNSAITQRTTDVELGEYCMEQVSEAPTPGSRSSLAASSSPSSEDGFLLVKPPKTTDDFSKAERSPPQSWAKVAANPAKSKMLPKKQKHDMNEFKVADDDGMVLTADGDGAGYRSSYSTAIRMGYSGR